MKFFKIERTKMTFIYLAESSSTISKTRDKYILNEHLIHTSRDLINQYERKAKYEKFIILILLVIYFVVALNIVKNTITCIEDNHV